MVHRPVVDRGQCKAAATPAAGRGAAQARVLPAERAEERRPRPGAPVGRRGPTETRGGHPPRARHGRPRGV